MKTAVMTDTNSGITKKEARELGLYLMPMPVIINGSVYYEDENIDEAGFYAAQSSGAEVSTSQPSPGEVLGMWDLAFKEGWDEIVYIPMTSGLSKSCEMAIGLAASYGGKVQVADNHRISVPLRESVLRAVSLAKEGHSAAGIKEQLEREAKERRIEAMRQAQGAEAAEGEQDPVEPAFIELEDGEYAISVELTGGSGRSAMDSPAGLLVRDGHAFARIRWSSSSYDYMLVGGQRYLPVNEEGYSTFEIPILIFDEPMEVIADTTAMSTPHEVEYMLVFHGDDIMSTDDTPQAAAKKVVCMALGIAAVCGLVSWIRERRRRARR